jgi:glycosyltransferase involved in cell wall biosynthesis
MRILLLTQILPFPPDSGPKVKTFRLIQYLSRHHELTLVSLVRSEAEVARAAELRVFCKDVYTVQLKRSKLRDLVYLIRSLVLNRSFIIERDACLELDALLAELTTGETFDVIHADQLNMAQFALKLPGATVLDEHNAVWTIVQRMAQHEPFLPKRAFLDFEARKLRRYESEVCAQFDAVMAVSEPDRWALELAATERGTRLASTTVIPIAVDTEQQQLIDRAAQPRTVLSMATMFWPPNVDGVLWFANEVYPLVKAAVPDVRFAVVGARPPQRVQRLAEADPSIVVTGYVDNPQAYLEASAALIVPVRAGGGMRVKILEALARGTPIVSTTVGYEGIALTPGEHLLVGDTPNTFAEAIVRLLQDPEFGRRMAAAGRRLAEERYDWRVVNPQIEGVYASVLAQHTTAQQRYENAL